MVLGNKMSENPFKISIDGKDFYAPNGKSLFSLLIENEIFELKKNAVSNQSRFGICGMGTCFECEIYIKNLGIRRACMVAIDADLEIQTGVNHE